MNDLVNAESRAEAARLITYLARKIAAGNFDEIDAKEFGKCLLSVLPMSQLNGLMSALTGES